MEQSFTWIPFQEEFANKILEFKNNRLELLKKMEKIFDDKSIGLDYPFEYNGKRKTDLDPFSIFASFNRGIKKDKKIKIIEKIIQEFNLNSEVPSDFDGVPNFYNQTQWLADETTPAFCDLLWDLYDNAIRYADDNTEDNKKKIEEIYLKILDIDKFSLRITIGLYWIRPKFYVSLHINNKTKLEKEEYVSNEIASIYKQINPKMPSIGPYLDLCEKMRMGIQENAFLFKSLPEFNNMPIKDNKDKKINSEVGEKDKNMDKLDKNMILYGPPGTGKTYKTAIYAVAICDPDKTLKKAEKMDYSEVMKLYKKLKEDGRIEFTTFHQSYGYEEFIEGIKPNLSNENDSKLEYSIEPGIFKKFCERAAHPLLTNKENKPYVFIIDEINRGNISKIFGELITLIEDTKRSGKVEGASAILPYSNTEFSVPDNVYILGTMNTADRSIALMDTALRRRFRFIEMMPECSVLRKIKVDDLDVAHMLEVMNARIEYLYDREHTIGHAFFTKLKEDPSIETLASIFEKDIIPLLQEYFYEDYHKIQLVLGDNDKKDELKFIQDNKIDSSIFKGDISDLDLPEKKYSINKKAFLNIDSYKEIG